MILIIEKGIRSGICQATHRYARANNRYLKNYDKKNESSYIEYLCANNLYVWAMLMMINRTKAEDVYKCTRLIYSKIVKPLAKIKK